MSNIEITFAVFLAIFALTGIVSLLSIIRFGRSGLPLITLPASYRAALFSSLILEVVAVVVGVGYTAVEKVSSATDKLSLATDTFSRFIVEKRQPSMLHDYVLVQRDISRVRILGLNGLSVLHKYREDLTNMIRNGDTVVEILLLDPSSKAFLNRRNLEETAPKESTHGEPQFVSGRIRAEWEASRAILRDIVNQLLHDERSMSVEEISARLKIKIHSKEPTYSYLFVDTSDAKFLIFNKYTKEKLKPGTSGGSQLIVPEDDRYVRAEERFNSMWEASDTEIRIKELEGQLTLVSLPEDS